MIEVAGREVTELRSDQNVGGFKRGNRGLDVLFGENAEHLSGDARNSVQLLALRSGVPTLTAITISAPIARAVSTGRLLVSMPSTSIMPPNSPALQRKPGTDMLARMTLANILLH